MIQLAVSRVMSPIKLQRMTTVMIKMMTQALTFWRIFKLIHLKEIKNEIN